MNQFISPQDDIIEIASRIVGSSTINILNQYQIEYLENALGDLPDWVPQTIEWRINNAPSDEYCQTFKQRYEKALKIARERIDLDMLRLQDSATCDLIAKAECSPNPSFTEITRVLCKRAMIVNPLAGVEILFNAVVAKAEELGFDRLAIADCETFLSQAAYKTELDAWRFAIAQAICTHGSGEGLETLNYCKTLEFCINKSAQIKVDTEEHFKQALCDTIQCFYSSYSKLYSNDRTSTILSMLPIDASCDEIGWALNIDSAKLDASKFPCGSYEFTRMLRLHDMHTFGDIDPESVNPQQTSFLKQIQEYFEHVNSFNAS